VITLGDAITAGLFSTINGNTTSPVGGPGDHPHPARSPWHRALGPTRTVR
jgi:hypothetical protein